MGTDAIGIIKRRYPGSADCVDKSRDPLPQRETKLQGEGAAHRRASEVGEGSPWRR
jgi:hypothetical protein